MKSFLGVALAALASASSGVAGPSLALQPCAAASQAWQQWALTPNQTKLYLVSSLAGGHPSCIDIKNFSTAPGATVYTYTCGDGSRSNEDWLVSASSVQSRQAPPTCLAVSGAAAPGAAVTTAQCAGGDAAQTLAFAPATGLIVHTPSGLCVDAGSPQPPAYWCGQGGRANWTICDAAADINARAADLVSRLSLADKYLALGTATPLLPSVGLPAYQWWSEATHGIGGPGVHNGGNLTGSINTALPITTSCSFNRTMWTKTGNQIAREGRAFRNRGLAGSTFWTPVINIVRDPRWGRNIESAGEDPFLSGQYAANFIQGFEHATEVTYPLQASACCKHFVANELEATNGSTRHNIDVFVPQQDLVDSYLPSFQTCVEEGKASGIMCSYNAVNGVPSCANDWLLGTLLRDAWAFDGCE
jgi:hypothetical protein